MNPHQPSNFKLSLHIDLVPRNISLHHIKGLATFTSLDRYVLLFLLGPQLSTFTTATIPTYSFIATLPQAEL
jgi:hypothetical protein